MYDDTRYSTESEKSRETTYVTMRNENGFEENNNNMLQIKIGIYCSYIHIHTTDMYLAIYVDFFAIPLPSLAGRDQFLWKVEKKSSASNSRWKS